MTLTRSDSASQRASPRLGELLESPRWHPERRKVSFVDIPTGRLFELTPGNPEIDEFLTGVVPLGAALPFGDEYLLVGSDGVWVWKPGDAVPPQKKWADIPFSEGTVSNDATFHEGVVWVGRMNEAEEPDQGSIWRVDPNSAERIISGLTLPNGMVASPRPGHMLLAESSAQVIYEFSLNASSLSLPELSVYADLSGWTPDGLAWDHCGRLWVARWGDGRISRLEDHPSGNEGVCVPTPQSTAVAFDDSGFMYVTTGHEGLSAEDVSTDRNAGALFVSTSAVGSKR